MNFSEKTKINRLIVMVLALILVFLLAGCGQDQSKSTTGEKKAIKVGLIASATGYVSTMGSNERDGALLAVDQVNKAGGINGKQIEVIFEDEKSEPKDSVTAATKLLNQDKVLVLAGPTISNGTNAVLPLIEQAKVAQVTFSVIGAQNEAKGTPYTFNVLANPEVEAGAAANYLLEKTKFKKVAIIYDSNVYGIGIKDKFMEAIKDKGIEVTASEQYKSTDSDFKPQLTKIKATKPEIIMQFGGGAAVPLIAKNKWELGIDSQLMGVTTMFGVGLEKFIEIAGQPASEGLLVVSYPMAVYKDLPDSDPRKQVITKFVDDFQAKFSHPPVVGAADLGYDGMKLLLNAIQKAGEDPAKIRDALENTKGYVGASAVIDYGPNDHRGADIKDLVVATLKNGKLVPVQ